MTSPRLRLEIRPGGRALLTPQAAATIAAAQERLLEERGRRWGSEAELLPLPRDWQEEEAVSRAATAIGQVLAAEGGHAADDGSIQVLEDPRVSLLLFLWRRVARQNNLSVQPVLVVGEPEPLSWSEQRHLWHRLRRLLLDAAAMGLPLRLEQQAPGGGGGAGAPLHAGVQAAKGGREPPLRLHPRLRRLLQELRGLAALPSDRQAVGLSRRINPGLHWAPEHLPPLAEHSGTVRQRLLRARLRLLPPLEPGPWFDAEHYRRQVPTLPADHDPLAHYRWRGWRHDATPHPLFDPRHYRQECIRRGHRLRGEPLADFLEAGVRQGLAPHPLADPSWLPEPRRRQLWRTARLDGLHPLGAAALALSGGEVADALALLHHWRLEGFRAEELRNLARAEERWFVLLEGLVSEERPRQDRSCQEIVLFGCGPHDWPTHAWLQHCPAAERFRLLRHDEAAQAGEADAFGLWLGPMAPGREGAAPLQRALGLAAVFCPDPEHTRLLRRLGIRARQLRSDAPANGWLADIADPEEKVAERLGLPPPQVLVQAGKGAPGSPVLGLGSGGELWERRLAPPLWGCPGFDRLWLEDAEDARLLAAWLNDCGRRGLQLVRIDATPLERQGRAWEALARPRNPPEGWLPPLCLRSPLSPGECLEELAWRAAGSPAPAPLMTPRPAARELWRRESGPAATAAVCVSLFNYAGRILAALDSVRAQTHTPLELIVVDDASEDDGPQRVRRWLEEHGPRFARALLLQHAENGGLAAARNTAFAAARAPWCFVLDADNRLEPEAVRLCLAIAAASPARTAVVHPLVELRSEGKQAGQPTGALLGRVSWQRAALVEGNQIDAMALVRRQAWKAVGGYCHIPGGWEDYDFWCKLIDAGYHGVLCPQRLAVYHQHPHSMQATDTLVRLRRLSRLLSTRHPWLRIHPDLSR